MILRDDPMTDIKPATSEIPAQMVATSLPRREFVQLANDYVPGKHDVSGWYISDKRDGLRGLWLGGVDRGLPTKEIPWANIYHPKTGQLKKKITPISTGLWSRSGNPIAAPDWFIKLLPRGVILDGELWAGIGQFQETMSICKQEVPDERWNQIRYAVYSSPTYMQVFTDGEVKNAQMWRAIKSKTVFNWLDERRAPLAVEPVSRTLADEIQVLEELLRPESSGDQVFVLNQDVLPEVDAAEAVERWLQPILAAGGEGVVLRDPHSIWIPKRHKGILKYKPESDSECRIIGFTAGEQGVTGNMLGKIGALVVEWLHNDTVHTFRLGTGMTMAEREFASGMDVMHAYGHPGAEMLGTTQGAHFKLGDVVTFKFREITDEGIPREARYFRKRGEE